MNVQVERYQPLISRRVVYGLQTLPCPPIITQCMEFGMRSLRHHVNQHRAPDEPSALLLPSIQCTRAPTAGSFGRNTQPTSRFSGSDKPLGAGDISISADPGLAKSVRFQQVHSDESQLSSISDSDEDHNARRLITKHWEEPGRPGSGGYKLENALSWNKATFDAVTVSGHTTEQESRLTTNTGLHTFVSRKEAQHH